MKYDELRRLAIRLARRREVSGDNEYLHCDACDCCKHTPDCPIAELEAEEAMSKLRPVEPKRNPDNCGPDIIHREY